MDKNLCNILIIDDDPLVLMNYSDILEDAGYTPTPVSNSIQAWNTLKDRDFELIICDHDLGDGKGIDLVKKLIGSGRNIPVLYLSGALPQVLEEIAKVPCVKKVLAKPVSRELLLENIKEFKKEISQEDDFHKFIGIDERKMLLENPLFK